MPRKTKTLKPFGGYQPTESESPITPPPAVRPAHKPSPIEVNIHLEKLTNEYFEKRNRDREKFAREWLIACGWNGEDIMAARRLAEGYAIVDLPGGGFAAERVHDIIDNALKGEQNTLEEKQ